MKFGKPHGPRPLTCAYWFSERGCIKPLDQCQFAHWNTGFLAGGFNTKPKPIPWERDNHNQAPMRLRIPKREVTCMYWAKGACTKSDLECEYAHRVTDTMAENPLKRKTCFFWALGSCNKTETQCMFAHKICDVMADTPAHYTGKGESLHWI
jgi:hypothetical protein